MPRLRSVFRAAIVAMALATASLCAAPPGASLVNRNAPDFARTTLDGKPLRLSALRGKVVLLNFWATWCAPCQIEMPTFARWQRELGPSGFQVIGISMDDSSQDASRAVQRLHISYPVAMGDEHLGKSYGGVLGLPLTFLIDRNGVIRARFQGETDPNAIDGQIKALLQPSR